MAAPDVVSPHGPLWFSCRCLVNVTSDEQMEVGAKLLGLTSAQVERIIEFCGAHPDRQGAVNLVLDLVRTSAAAESSPWSACRPARTGLYWMRRRTGTTCHIVLIDEREGELRVRMFGNPMPSALDARWDTYEWRGPLVPPQ